MDAYPLIQDHGLIGDRSPVSSRPAGAGWYACCGIRAALFIGSRYASGVFARATESGYDAGVCYQRDKIVDGTLPLVRRLKR